MSVQSNNSAGSHSSSMSHPEESTVVIQATTTSSMLPNTSCSSTTEMSHNEDSTKFAENKNINNLSQQPVISGEGSKKTSSSTNTAVVNIPTTTIPQSTNTSSYSPTPSTPTNNNNTTTSSSLKSRSKMNIAEDNHHDENHDEPHDFHHEKLPLASKQSTNSHHAFDEHELERTQQLLETALFSIIHKYNTDTVNQQQQQQTQVPQLNVPVPLPVTLPSITTINSPVVLQETMALSGEKKSKESIDQTIILSLLSGVFVGFGAIASFKTGGNMPGWDVENPGFGKLIFSAVFTVGLMLVIVSGSELFTGNTMVMFVAMLRKKVTAWHVVKNLCLSLTFNVLGAFMTIYFFMYLPTTEKELHTPAGFVSYAKKVGEAKVSRSAGLTILLGIGCNWLVCLAVYMTYASNVLVDKLIGLFMPILAFVAGGFEHSVANGAFIPLAMLYGSDITMYDFLVSNLMPATLGNLLGGAIFVGMAFWYTHGVRMEHLYFFDEHFILRMRATIAQPILNLWDRLQKFNPFLKKEEAVITAQNIELPEHRV
ncbi:hypothetical protein C9374_010155 [Naegleria lovaniensis]|uniref:Formate/nitrite transporter n=1 Tax=Naegleria lovaniensis TaxID=51637 RepID=A0AA88GJ74_NAELO|nr:uncharacterized protein C9374_010155 [Naegleria lovaniensis]KAG2375151.1 hypothetical protein C9374_010155 [Naegleria lovaniensis]